MTADADENLRRLVSWAEALDDSTYYEILGVLELADDQAIRDAFHDFASRFHPDVHMDAPPHARTIVERIYRIGAEAYRVLVDPAQRSRYDLALARGHTRLGDAEAKGAGGATPDAKSLEEICKTPAARLRARVAPKLIDSGDLAGARKELRQALHHDGNLNPDLKERIEALNLALFASGN